MAKSKSFFGLRKGSTKTMTYSVLRGQQITKDRVTDIANPRTMDQTLQRIPFAQAVKFYKQATKGLFRFAYEDKKPLESDYNAFMRHNVKYASSVSLDNYNNPSYPALGNWLLSKGSLPAPNILAGDDSYNLVIADTEEECVTVGDITPYIIAKYDGLAEGDIVTFVGFSTTVNAQGQLTSINPPIMLIKQFVLDSASEISLSSLGFEEVLEDSAALAISFGNENYAAACSVIFTRNSPSGLKVSDSVLYGNTVWGSVLESNLSESTMEGNAFSWGASQKAILQGALAE